MTQVSLGILNLTHRDSHAAPTPLPVGEPIPVRLMLNACGQRIPAGTKIRLALSTAYWPVIFPPPEPVRLTVDSGCQPAVSCRSAPQPTLIAICRPSDARKGRPR